MMQIEGLRRHDIDAHGMRIHVAEAGEGPLVLFVHGFPESWYSWRHQIVALAAAGYRAAAIDVRGYGSSEAPDEVDAYRIIHLAGDCVGVVEALGAETATIVGHDWGSPTGRLHRCRTPVGHLRAPQRAPTHRGVSGNRW